jgi:hypothetical protein
MARPITNKVGKVDEQEIRRRCRSNATAAVKRRAAAFDFDVTKWDWSGAWTEEYLRLWRVSHGQSPIVGPPTT